MSRVSTIRTSSSPAPAATANWRHSFRRRLLPTERRLSQLTASRRRQLDGEPTEPRLHGHSASLPGERWLEIKRWRPPSGNLHRRGDGCSGHAKSVVGHRWHHQLENSSPAKALRFSVQSTLIGALVGIYADGTLIGSTTQPARPRSSRPTARLALADAAFTYRATRRPSGGQLASGSPRPNRLRLIPSCRWRPISVAFQFPARRRDRNADHHLFRYLRDQRRQHYQQQYSRHRAKGLHRGGRAWNFHQSRHERHLNHRDVSILRAAGWMGRVGSIYTATLKASQVC